MPMFIFNCQECGNIEKRIDKNKDILCSKCNSKMEKNIIESSKKQMFDNVPGGFADTEKWNRRTSHEGQLQEAAFLSGETKNAY